MILGIDLGTTNSAVGIWRDGGVELIPNSLGHSLTPSAVSLDDDGKVLVGLAARERQVSHPDRTATAFKRFMGTSHGIVLGKRRFLPEELSALVLRSLKADAELHLGGPVTDAIITVPAYFNDKQRKATRRAFVAGGLACIAIQWAILVRYVGARFGGAHTGQDFLVVVFVPQCIVGLWWVSLAKEVEGGSADAAITPFFGLMIASALGSPALRTLWIDNLDRSQRRIAMALLASFSMAVGAAVWWLATDVRWRPACAALVMIVLALHRPVTMVLSDAQHKLRVAWIVLLLAGLFFASVTPQVESRGVVLTGCGLVLIATAMFSMVLEYWNEVHRDTTRQAGTSARSS